MSGWARIEIRRGVRVRDLQVWKVSPANPLISFDLERNLSLFIHAHATGAILPPVSPAGTPVMTVVCGEEPALGRYG
jgi:hypothetical protein